MSSSSVSSTGVNAMMRASPATLAMFPTAETGSARCSRMAPAMTTSKRLPQSGEVVDRRVNDLDTAVQAMPRVPEAVLEPHEIGFLLAKPLGAVGMVGIVPEGEEADVARAARFRGGH